MSEAETLPDRPEEAGRLGPAKPQRALAAPPRRRLPAPIEYPETDDEPMGESFLHIDLSLAVYAILVGHFANRPDACLGCDNFIYYEEGNPRAVVVPDVFVVFGVPKKTDRRVFKVWEEGAVPAWVLEVTSKKTKRNDEREKKDLYERLGVMEYWQFDPTGDYLDPILKCRALGPDGKYVELGLESRDGGLCRFSNVLGLDLRLEDEELGFFDPALGEYLPSPWEQQQVIGKQRRDLGEQREVIGNQRKVIGEQGSLIERQRRDLGEQRQLIGEQGSLIEQQGRDLGEQGNVITQQGQVIDEQRHVIQRKDRALEAAMARIRELERQRRP